MAFRFSRRPNFGRDSSEGRGREMLWRQPSTFEGYSSKNPYNFYQVIKICNYPSFILRCIAIQHYNDITGWRRVI
jgi:hypothetical protein